MFCSRCGASFADGSQFCVDCGHTVEGAFPAAPAPASESVCAKCNRTIFPGARFCSNCGTAAPPPKIITAGAGGSAAAAAAAAHDPLLWRRRRRWSTGKLVTLTLAVLVLVGGGWLLSTHSSVAPQIKSYITTDHAEMITDGSIAIKPHGFASYRISVPDGAIDVTVNGQFDASGRNDKNVQVLVLTDSEFVVWQGGYAISPFYDSGSTATSNLQASLPARAGSYYLIVSNKPSRVEKTVHITAGLHYDTWLPDSVVALKQKIWGWFE